MSWGFSRILLFFRVLYQFHPSLKISFPINKQNKDNLPGSEAKNDCSVTTCSPKRSGLDQCSSSLWASLSESWAHPTSFPRVAGRVSVHVHSMVRVVPAKWKDWNEEEPSLLVNAQVFHFGCKGMLVKWPPAIPWAHFLGGKGATDVSTGAWKDAHCVLGATSLGSSTGSTQQETKMEGLVSAPRVCPDCIAK